ncbi:AAA family ATPase [Gemmatimonas groenlandica]|uniref:AAA family ATPase n=1 Tax=Gemmatimonas groenlandica TaxID=2732249 RepID=UPI00198221A0|nr:ATP-binding protein [Gemmatimonas groenlandica]
MGKTTLGAQLAARFGVACVPEFVRDYAAAKGAPLDFRDHGPIAKGQMALEDANIAAATARGDALLLQDTDLVSTVVYCHHYFGRCPEFIEQAAIARRPTHYLLLDIDVPWIADGIRDRGEQRDEVQALFRETLARFDAPVTVVRGKWDERLATAAALIDVLLDTHRHG